jgi:hypothetical protein
VRMWLFFLAPVITILLMGIVHGSESLEKIRLHWNEYRCNPIYMPFAGVVRPDIGTQENFQHCMNMFGQSIFKYVLDVINMMLKDVVSGVEEVGKPLPLMRQLMTRMRGMLLSFGAQTFGKITNSMGSLSYILLKIRDVLERFAGQGYISAFLAQTGMSFLYGFVMLVMNLIKIFVYALLAISFILALFQPEMLVLAIVLASSIAASGF